MKTKKIVSLLLALVMLLSITAGLSVSAFAEYSGDFYYELLEDGTAEIQNYEGADTDLVIPSELDGYTVTGIGDYAFSGSEIASIVIPDSVTHIGSGAFSGCYNLTDIIVGENNENYIAQDGVLFNKDKTELITYPAGLEGSSYSIPEGVTSIANSAFDSCERLTAIEIPDSVESIGDFAFSFSGLTSIELPGSVTSIGEGAFSSCYGLTEITIPVGVAIIGSGAFDSCELKAINVDENNENYSSQDGVLFNKDKTELIMYPAGLESASYTIPEGVKSIASGAFAVCANLTAINIPDSVKSIGDSAFSFCYGLTEITIPDSVTSIGDYAFSGCYFLSNVVFGNGVTDIGDQAFGDCMSLTSIEIPDNVKNIGYMAFVFSGIKSAVIGRGITNFNATAFWNCENFESIYIMNKDCDIIDENGVLKTVTIYGYTDSTAQAYAEKNGLKFVPLDEEPVTEEPTTEEPTTQKPADKPVTEDTTNAPATEAETKPAQNNADKSDSAKSPSTGAESKALFAIAAMAIAGGAVMFAKKKEND